MTCLYDEGPDPLICARRNCGREIFAEDLDDCDIEAVMTDVVEAPDSKPDHPMLRGRVRFLCPDCTTVFRAELAGQASEKIPESYWDDDGEEFEMELL